MPDTISFPACEADSFGRESLIFLLWILFRLLFLLTPKSPNVQYCKHIVLFVCQWSECSCLFSFQDFDAWFNTENCLDNNQMVERLHNVSQHFHTKNWTRLLSFDCF